MRGTFVAGGESKDDSAHACDFSPQTVIEGSGYTEDDTSDGCVVKRIGGCVYSH